LGGIERTSGGMESFTIEAYRSINGYTYRYTVTPTVDSRYVVDIESDDPDGSFPYRMPVDWADKYDAIKAGEAEARALGFDDDTMSVWGPRDE
jgi:hypothetical protein